MKTGIIRKITCLMLAAVLVVQPFSYFTENHTVFAETGRVNASKLNLRSGPGTNYSSVRMLSANTSIEILETVTGTDGKTWYKVQSGTDTGFLRSDYVSKDQIYNANDADFESYLNSQGFPESYKNSLRGLHQKYPSWIFKALDTGIEWDTVIAEESRIGLNLVASDSISSWKSIEPGGFDWAGNYWPGYDGASWVAASSAIIAHYMDPRNFLSEPHVFQFEVQSYNPAVQTREGLEGLVKGTFLEGYPAGSASGSSLSFSGPASAGSSAAVNTTGVSLSAGPLVSAGPGQESSPQSEGPASVTASGNSYCDLIMTAAAQSGVSPYVLAAMIIQEQGIKGNGPMISGNYGAYAGYYNFYNTAAYEHDGMSAIEAGLKYASESGNGNRPWNTIEKAVIGGAVAYGENFTNSGQDTFYLKKFNVQGSNKYKHQFMSNVIAAEQEGCKVAKAYTDAIKSTAMIFSIPVYRNMPEAVCELPATSGNPNNKLRNLSIDGFSLTPSFNMNTESYSVIVDGSVSSVNVSAVCIDQNASVSGAGLIPLGTGVNNIDISVKAENGTERIYKLSITRKQGQTEGNDPTNLTGPAGTPANSPAPQEASVSNVTVITTNSAGSEVIIGGAPGE